MIDKKKMKAKHKPKIIICLTYCSSNELQNDINQFKLAIKNDSLRRTTTAQHLVHNFADCPLFIGFLRVLFITSTTFIVIFVFVLLFSSRNQYPIRWNLMIDDIFLASIHNVFKLIWFSCATRTPIQIQFQIQMSMAFVASRLHKNPSKNPLRSKSTMKNASHRTSNDT